jgi:hypothetical protein
MSGLFSSHTRRIIEAPLHVPGGRVLVGDALWLYFMLASRANYRGVVCRQSDRLAEDLGLEEKQLAEWLDRLGNAGLIEVHAPKPYLVIKLLAWSDSEETERRKAPDLKPSGGTQMEVPVSSSNAAAAASSKQEDGGQGEGEALLHEVLAALDEADADEFRHLLRGRSPEVVRRALHRVQTTPPQQIRKSKAALFRYLLTKLS